MELGFYFFQNFVHVHLPCFLLANIILIYFLVNKFFLSWGVMFSNWWSSHGRGIPIWGHSKQRNAIAILAKGNKNFCSQIQLALANLAKIKYTV